QAFGAQSYRGLRGWIDTVGRLGELKRVAGAHWDVEMGAITHMLTEKSDGTARTILFDDVPGYPKGYRSTTTSMPAISTRCYGRCARASIRRSISIWYKRPGRRNSIRLTCPAISTIAS